MDEVLRTLYDTIILLGGKPDIAQFVLCPDLVDEAALNDIRRYNVTLLESVKDRLANLNKSEVQVVSSTPTASGYSSHNSPSD